MEGGGLGIDGIYDQPGLSHCLGCRFGCRADRLQCGRGIQLQAAAGESGGIGSREGAGGSQEGAGAPCEYKADLTAEARLSHVLPQAARQLEKSLAQGDAQRLAGVLERHGGYMSLKMLSAHAGVGPDARDAALDPLRERGFVEIVPIDPCGKSARLTEAGTLQAAAWREELDRACDLFASPLSHDECQQLVTLLFKLVHAER